MQVVVRSLKSSFVVELPEGSSASDLKAAIEDMQFIPADLQRLTKDSMEFESLEDGDFLNLLVDVSGGMRAKWRKKRMRRLRRKRRKMRMRAR